MNSPQKKLYLGLFVTITDVSDTNTIDDLLQKAGIPVQYRCRGKGTARNEVLDALGLSGHDKAITICVISKGAIGRMVHALSNELNLHKPGHGIAFAVPLSGASSPVLQLMDSRLQKEIVKQLESDVSEMSENPTYSLVLAAVSPGYSDGVMEVARENGAGGGTIIHARRLGMEDTFKFWGISVNSEKEIIAILVLKEQRLPLMAALGEKFGTHSEAHGLVFSLPIEEVAGLGEANSQL